MGGDFNVVMKEKDKGKHLPAALLRKAEREIGLADIWQILNPQEKRYTYYSEAHKIYSLVSGYFFIFKDSITRVKKCEIEPISLGNHAT